MRATKLFAEALGLPANRGDYDCFWCGSPCDDSHAVKVTGTFWDWDVVANSKSPYQCIGCKESLNSKREMTGREKLQRTWTYSWLITRDSAKPWTKADLAEMRNACLNPPSAPWALAIAESGQKHILFRTPVNLNDTAPFVVQLELIQVSYLPWELESKIELCAKIAAACGKPSLTAPLDLSLAMRLHDYHGETGIELERQWRHLHNNPVTRLAAFLSPSMEDAKRVYPADPGRERVPPKTGGTRRRGSQRSLFP